MVTEKEATVTHSYKIERIIELEINAKDWRGCDRSIGVHSRLDFVFKILHHFGELFVDMRAASKLHVIIFSVNNCD